MKKPKPVSLAHPVISCLHRYGRFIFAALSILLVASCNKHDLIIPVAKSLKIISITPDSNSNDITLDTNITVTFDAPVDSGKTDRFTIYVEQDNKKVEGRVDISGAKAVFTPAKDFSPNTTYKVSIKKGIGSEQGRYLQRDLYWTFTTKSADTYEMVLRSNAVTDFVRDGSRTLQIGNYLYSYGGWTAVPERAYSDVYRSSGDLTEWKKRPDAPWHGRHVFGVAQLNGVSYVIGGDNLDREFDVWSTTDGETWSRKATDLLDARVYAGITAHNGYLYVVGGLWEKDVWRSKDGVSWTMMSANVPFLNEENYAGSLASFNGKLWMVCGGGDGGGGGTFHKWVWSSADGSTWTREPDFGGSERSYTDVCVWDNKLWVIGGYNTTESNCRSIWYMSRTGQWTEIPTPADYLGRHATAVSVYNNKLAITCGNYNNDCWVISKVR